MRLTKRQRLEAYTYALFMVLADQEKEICVGEDVLGNQRSYGVCYYLYSFFTSCGLYDFDLRHFSEFFSHKANTDAMYWWNLPTWESFVSDPNKGTHDDRIKAVEAAINLCEQAKY
jgi:hypothetical protein